MQKKPLFFGLGCGCLTLILLVLAALYFFLTPALKEAAQEFRKIEVANALWTPPADGSWDENDWPPSLGEGWTKTATTHPIPSFFTADLATITQTASYQNQQNEFVHVYVLPTTEQTKEELSHAVKNYEPNAGTSSNNNTSISNAGNSRHVRSFTTDGQKQCYVVWGFPNWSILFIGTEKETTLNAADAFLLSIENNSTQTQLSNPESSANSATSAVSQEEADQEEANPEETSQEAPSL